ASILTTGTPTVGGRRLSIGIGAEYNRDSLTNAFTLNGSWYRDYRSIYGEARVPIVEGEGDQTLLELNLAGRWDDYSDFGSSTNPKVALTWRPSSDHQISATWGQGYRAPTLYNLYSFETASILPATVAPFLPGQPAMPDPLSPTGFA